ncbi:hypothetical protein NDU88_001733 [Pleurodeles waltl]|uniref:Uncharacterized protein n=1 Tax=Pleurodeles waltl TaxID=8319 RepID=A0AAV7UV61_PLEWA|nr:hypothetical protein NDU88_001733 [Pleurodeles waltl]
MRSKGYIQFYKQFRERLTKATESIQGSREKRTRADSASDPKAVRALLARAAHFSRAAPPQLGTGTTALAVRDTIGSQAEWTQSTAINDLNINYSSTV